MFSLFKKSCVGVFSILLLNTLNSSLIAWDCCGCDAPSCNRLYIGAFGGELYSNKTKITQMGTALFSEAEGGPLAVDARGHAKRTDTGFGGAQIGYEWAGFPFMCSCSDWTISPALEIEGYWYSHKRKGHLNNSTDLERLPEHDFLDTFHMDMGVYLANAVFTLNTNSFWGIAPYVGVGAGAAHVSIHKADSLQVDPPEAGINHFNSRRSDSSWAFAAQAKLGLRYKITNSFHIFGEYRCLYINSSNYIFGSTVYPTHAHTTPWNVKIQNLQYNAFAVGIQYDL